MTQTLKVPGTPAIAVNQTGEGPLTVLLHGIGGNKSNWTSQLSALAPHFKTIAWDARGYGDSDDYDGPLAFEDFCHDLARVLDFYDTESAHICGLSMGGQIAQHFYRLYPERVRSLTLAATFTRWRAVLSESDLKAYLDLRLTPLRTGSKTLEEIAPLAAPTILGPNASPQQIAQVAKSMVDLHHESYLKTLESATAFEQELDLASINVPTLLIFAEHDRLCPADYGRSMAARINGAEFAYVEDAGHLINIEKPELFSDLLLQFLLRAE